MAGSVVNLPHTAQEHASLLVSVCIVSIFLGYNSGNVQKHFCSKEFKVCAYTAPIPEIFTGGLKDVITRPGLLFKISRNYFKVVCDAGVLRKLAIKCNTCKKTSLERSKSWISSC